MEAGLDAVLAFGWCVLAGFLMSMGAGGGGILVGVGHISILGIADANMIKVLNQILEFSSRLVSVPLYYRQRRIVGSLAIAYGIGAPIGAIAGSWLSRYYLQDISTYRILFGVLVGGIAVRTLYEGWRDADRASAEWRRAVEVSDRSSRALQKGRGLNAHDGPRTIDWRPTAWTVRFNGEQFVFKPVAAALGGAVIGFVGSMVGVGGGFLVTPFMASVLLFPMYLVVGTSLVALMIPLTVSVLTYLALHVNVDWLLVAFEVPGVLAGSVLGPVVNRRMNEKLLKTFVAAVLLLIGLYYVAWPA